MFVNTIPAAPGFSTVYSPRGIVTGRKLYTARDCKVQFGTYVEATEDASVTNTVHVRTHNCITLRISGNRQGSTMCFDLQTINAVTRCVVTELPMPDRITALVNRLDSQARGNKYADDVQFLNCKQEFFEWEMKK